MKTALSLSQLATRIESDKRATRDFIAPVTAMRMTDAAQLTVTGSVVDAPLTNTGHIQLANYTDMPREYYDRMFGANKALLAANVNQWLPRVKNRKGETDRRMVRTLHGDVRALLSDRYHRIDNHIVADITLGVLAKIPGVTVRSADVTERRMYIKVSSDQIVAPDPGVRRVGSMVEAGVIISNSEIGDGSVNIQPFANFLWCMNGMVREGSGLRATHLGRKIDESLEGMLSDETKRLEDAVVMRKINDVLTHAFNRDSFLYFMDGLKDATKQKITGDVPAAVELLGPVLGLNGSERSAVLTHLINEGDLSRYGMANAITRAAADIESYDRATELEAAGWNVITVDKSSWQRIAEAKPLRQAA